MSFLKTMWKSNSMHKKLSEECVLHSEPMETIEIDSLNFKLKYLGTTIVEKVQHENVTETAVKTIIQDLKATRKKVRKVNLALSLKGVLVTDKHGNELLQISIYRISKCTTNCAQRQIFSFVSTDEDETTRCHAFACANRRAAETVALSVANTFSRAFEAWRLIAMLDHHQLNSLPTPKIEQLIDRPATKIEQLIDLPVDCDDVDDFGIGGTQNSWVSFDQ